MADLRIYRRKMELIKMAAACLVLIFISVMLLRHPDQVRAWQRVAAALAIPLCGVSLAYYLFRLCVPRPALVIGDEGLFDNVSFISAGMLRWEEIRDVYAYEFMGHKMLGIVPVDERVAVGRLSRVKQLMLQTNRSFGAPPFNIPLKVLPVADEDLLASIGERQRNARLRWMG